MKISEARKKALLDAIRMFARIYVLAALPLIIRSLEIGEIDLKAINLTGAIAVLKAVDEYIHKYGEATKNPSLEAGLTRF